MFKQPVSENSDVILKVIEALINNKLLLLLINNRNEQLDTYLKRNNENRQAYYGFIQYFKNNKFHINKALQTGLGELYAEPSDPKKLIKVLSDNPDILSFLEKNIPILNKITQDYYHYEQQLLEQAAELAKKEPVISLPSINKAKLISGARPHYKVGYCSSPGNANRQEDGLAWQLLPENNLTAQEIGHRLWTSYQLLEENADKTEAVWAGSGAITTLYNPNTKNLITATLGDSASFIVIYNNLGRCVGVKRLNTILHQPIHPVEQQRLTAAGDLVALGQALRGTLKVSRSIGFQKDKDKIISDAKIDISTIDNEALAEEFAIASQDIANVQLIVASAGFKAPVVDYGDIDPVNSVEVNKTSQENYLKDCIEKYANNINSADNNEKTLAEFLVNEALVDKEEDFFEEKDNISLMVANLTDSSNTMMMSVFDGHKGFEIAEYVAKNMASVLQNQLILTAEDYNEHPLSVNKQQERYERGNVVIAELKVEEKDEEFKEKDENKIEEVLLEENIPANNPQNNPSPEVTNYEDALRALKETCKRVYLKYPNASDLKIKVNKLIRETVNNKDTHPAQCIKVLTATNALLNNMMDTKAYNDLAKHMQGNASPSLQFLGGLMIAIGLLAAVAGIVIAAAVVPIPTTAVIALSCSGSLAALLGDGLFAAGKKKGMAKQMDNVSEEFAMVSQVGSS